MYVNEEANEGYKRKAKQGRENDAHIQIVGSLWLCIRFFFVAGQWKQKLFGKRMKFLRKYL